MAINFPNDPSTNPGNGGQWTDPGGSGTWEVELINGEAIWTLVSNDSGGGSGGGGAVSLNELNDVTLSSPQDTNVLQYNSDTGVWINAPAPAAGNVNLNDIGDVDTTGGTTGDLLVKQANGNWEAQTPSNTAGIGEAPEDGSPYVRQDATWISMPDNGGGATLNIDEAPADGQAYTRKDNAWVPGVESTSGSTAQIEGDNNIDTGTSTRAVPTGQVLTYDGSKFAPAALPADNVGLGEAPNDGKQYARQSEAWTEVVASGDGGGDSSITWTIGATGTASYDFSGPGFPSTAVNPALTVVRGQTYVFNNTSGSHPFQIQSTSGVGGTAYSAGVTGNSTIGEVTFVVPMDAPAALFYQCTAHAAMNGTIAVLENSAGGDGGSGGVEEAPEDGLLYARTNGTWSALSGGTELNWGKASTSDKGMAATEIGGFTGEAAAVAEGFTIVTLSEPDDDGNPVQLPASFNNTTWFDANDPQSASAGYQTIYVSGNGWASFLSASAVSNGTFPSFETGYDPVNSNMADINLLFGFHNADMVLDMVATKQVDQYFVIHIQWKDDYGMIFQAAGDGADEGVYPFPPYDPNADPSGGGGEARKRDVKGDTRVPTQVLVTGELWLGLDGSVRMVYGKNPVAFGLREDGKSNGFSQQTNGIYKAGAPVTEVMGTSLEFSTFATNPLYYGLETTLDGTINVDKVFDWYVAYELGTTPFLTDAPEDGKVYGRKDGGWIEASAGGGDDSSGGAAGGNPSGTPDYFAPQSRRMAQGLMPPFSNYSTADDSQAPIVRPKESLSAFFRYFQPGAQAFEDAGTWSLQPGNVIFFHSEDNALNSPFGFGTTASDLAVLTEIYQTNGQVLDPNFVSSNIVYIFATARFWREYPGTAEEWRYVSVDFHIPIDYTQSPTAASGYTALKLAEELFGTEEGEVTSFLDLIGCTQSELEGTHIPDPAPAIIQNHTADNSAVLEIYTRPVNSNTVNPGGGGAAKKRAGRTNGPLDHNMPAGIPVQDGCVLVWREEPDVTQNLGSTGDGGGGGAAKKARLSPKEQWDQMSAKSAKQAKELRKQAKPKLSLGYPKARKNPGGLGYQIPGYSETNDDPRVLYARTVNCQAPRFEGQVQYDKLAFWDLHQVSTFLKGEDPATGDYLAWDALNQVWDLASYLTRAHPGMLGAPQITEIIAALKANPELKAALKAALAD